jgi:predicted transcriptional regulator
MSAIKRVTLTDIASYAGVSSAAVSYYFMGGEKPYAIEISGNLIFITVVV